MLSWSDPTLIKALLFVVLLSNVFIGQAVALETIKAVVPNPSDYTHADKLEDSINGEQWGFHSGPIGIPTVSSTLESQGSNRYGIR